MIFTLPHTVLVTGATGLVGARVVDRLLRCDEAVQVCVLVRTATAAAVLRSRAGAGAERITTLVGDVTLPGLGLGAAARRWLAGSVRAVVHAAADTTFSRPLVEARAVNTDGTRHVLELAAAWNVERFVHLSTAYVAGAQTGPIAERSLSCAAGFVNGYEQSKHEAELIVRSSSVPYVVVRPSTIVCDDVHGRVTQYNAVHRALRAFHAGFGALMPGTEDTPVDLVTTAHVVDGTLTIGFSPDALNGTYHLCAGVGAIALGELLDRAHAVWSRDAMWRRRGILRPALTDLDTYRLFEQTVNETGDIRLATITRSLSHFVPQLAMPKLFDTRLADEVMGRRAVPVSRYWEALVEHLVRSRWGAERSAA